MDQAYEEVPAIGSLLGLEDVSVLALKDGLFERLHGNKPAR